MAVFNSFHNEQILKLDVKQQQPNAIPRFVQYDSALLKIELYDNGKKYDVSRAEEFVVSIKRPDGEMVSGLAEYDGEFINYKLTKQDLEVLGEVQARLQVYEGRNRLSSLNFRYDVYEDYETVGDIEEQTLLSQLFTRLWNALTEAQRQGNYAENRGDFANDAGDYAMDAGDSQKMRWLHWVKTVSERNSKYPRPRNGDTVYVVNVSDKNGGAVYRYNSIQSPAKWEEIAGWDTSIIQDIYNLIATKEDKTEVARLVAKLENDLETTYFGATNLIRNTEIVPENDFNFRPVVATSDVTAVTTEGQGRMIQVRQQPNIETNSYFGATVGYGAKERFSVQEGREYVLSFIGTKSLTATDFTYVYLMRTDGSNQKLYPKRIYSIDSTNAMKYEFVFEADWSSDSAYILIGSNKEEGYEGHAYWIRFKDVKLEHGNKATDWSPSFDDLINNYKKLIKEVDDKTTNELTKHSSRIEQLEDEITMTVTKKQYNDQMKLIGEWQSEYKQTAENIKTTVSKKVGASEIISVINQSAEAVTIDARKIKLGGDVVIEGGIAKIKNIDFNTAKASGGTSKEYVQLDHDEIVLRGQYTRTWRNKIERNNDVLTRLRLGHLRFRNNTLDRSLYYSDFGISTYVDGDGDAASSGTINFFDTEYSTARGLTAESNFGVVALRSNENRIILDSYLTANIESSQYSIYFRPMRDSRGGLNEFQMWVKENPSAAGTDGVLSFGNLTSKGDYGAGLRFSKQRGVNTIYATNPNGDMGTGNFNADGFIGDLVAPASYVYAVGERMRVITAKNKRNTYAEFQAGDGMFNSIRTNDGDVNFYFGVSSQELRVTNNLLWNGGKTGYRPVRASNFIEASSEKFKSNIRKWDTSVLDEFRNNIQLYSYNLNSDLESGREQTRHGVIVERETPESWINGDGIVNYEIAAWTVKGVQELVHENDKLKSEVDTLKQEMAELRRLVLNI